MPTINVLGREVELEFIVGEDATHALDRDALTEGATEMAARINSISHQIGVANMLGCSQHEIQHLEDFRRDQRRSAERLDEGVNRLAAHRPGELSAAG